MACTCQDCKANDRREANIDRARSAAVTVICARCGNPTDTTVGHVLAMRGAVICCKKKRR